MRTIAIAGGSGALGRRVAARMIEKGWKVRVLTRDAARLPAALHDGAIVGDGRDAAVATRLVEGVDAVFSCAGASVQMGLGHGWRGYGAVDPRVNGAIVEAARKEGRARFTYVSVFHTPEMRSLAYVEAHERVVERIEASGLAHAIVRPTGFFSAIGAYVEMARKGALPEIGDGTARSNPIDDDELAAVCVEAIEARDAAMAIDVGGPEVLTRREMGALAFAAIGKRAKYRSVPPWIARAAAACLRPVHPRIAQFAKFVAAIGTRDLIAPARGTRRLRDAYAERVTGAGSRRDRS